MSKMHLPKIEEPELTHVFVGATTGYGLRHGTPCRILRKTNEQGMQMAHIQDGEGKGWIVPASRVKPEHKVQAAT